MQTALRGFVSSIITPFRAVSRTIAACVVSALPDDPVPAQQAQNFERRVSCRMLSIQLYIITLAGLKPFSGKV